jgi:two-component system chemotaxis sensor kinase CheA
MCLLLDELLGKEEVVIKSMGEIMKDVPGIAGGAIMGDGRVGLILDMAGIWQMAMRSPNAA